jgi:hypothetical protein
MIRIRRRNARKARELARLLASLDAEAAHVRPRPPRLLRGAVAPLR